MHSVVLFVSKASLRNTPTCFRAHIHFVSANDSWYVIIWHPKLTFRSMCMCERTIFACTCVLATNTTVVVEVDCGGTFGLSHVHTHARTHSRTSNTDVKRWAAGIGHSRALFPMSVMSVIQTPSLHPCPISTLAGAEQRIKALIWLVSP